MSVTAPGARRALALAVSLIWLLVAVAPVAAHAELQATFPKADASVETPPRTVAARFSETIIGDSSIELRDQSGASLATGGIDPDDDRRLILTAPAGLEPGEYEVRWRVFSADGHGIERGTFTFTVLAPTPPPATPEPSATAAPTTQATAEPTEVPLPSPSATPEPAPTSGTDVAIPIVAALVVLGGLGLFLLRGRSGRRT